MGSSLRPEDIPALPEWGIAEGDVEAFLEMVWHFPDNGHGLNPIWNVHSDLRFGVPGETDHSVFVEYREPSLETDRGVSIVNVPSVHRRKQGVRLISPYPLSRD